jgi:hypothetical protein
MKRKLKDIDTAIRQWLCDFCERRSQNTKRISVEIMWERLSWWILNP